MLANLLHDVRYALHGFALRPMFAIVVVLTLAVGIGVNVAVFSIFDRLMLRELNVASPHELVNVVSPGPRCCNITTNHQGSGDATFSYPMVRDLERAGAPFVDLAASRGRSPRVESLVPLKSPTAGGTAASSATSTSWSAPSG